MREFKSEEDGANESERNRNGRADRHLSKGHGPTDVLGVFIPNSLLKKVKSTTRHAKEQSSGGNRNEENFGLKTRYIHSCARSSDADHPTLLHSPKSTLVSCRAQKNSFGRIAPSRETDPADGTSPCFDSHFQVLA